MKIIHVDDHIYALEEMKLDLPRIVPEAELHSFNHPDQALAFAETEGCDVLLTDTDLARAHTDGFMLAERIQAINPRVNIIFITEQADGKYACAAYRLHASGYLTKPFDPEDLDAEFANLRFAAG